MKNVNIRFPDDLHAKVKVAAGQDHRSFNAEVLWLIEQALRDPKARPTLQP